MEEEPARLVVTRGPNADEVYGLAQTQTSLGRSADNDIVLRAPEISRRHATIHYRGDQHFLEDLGSTNGTFVNGRRLIGAQPLSDGDKIQFGDSTLISYHNPTAVTQVVAPPPAVASPPAPHAAIPQEPAAVSEPDFIIADATQPALQRRWMIGCGCLPLLLLFTCASTLFALDAYQQGRLLYCGPLRPLFEVLLGPFGFNPICTIPF